MQAIDEALVISLGIDCEKNITPQSAIDSFEIRALKHENFKLTNEIEELNTENERLKAFKSNDASEEIIALQTKCELYKHQYEALLEKVIGR